jgi:hypothetical protein
MMRQSVPGRVPPSQVPNPAGIPLFLDTSPVVQAVVSRDHATQLEPQVQVPGSEANEMLRIYREIPVPTRSFAAAS